MANRHRNRRWSGLTQRGERDRLSALATPIGEERSRFPCCQGYTCGMHTTWKEDQKKTLRTPRLLGGCRRIPPSPPALAKHRRNPEVFGSTGFSDPSVIHGRDTRGVWQ